MFKRSNIKRFVVGSIFTAILITGASSFATGRTTRNIEAIYNNIKVVVDNKPVNLKDSTGKNIEPFIYEGTTYLPIRGIGEALNKKVDWDAKTQTVYVGENPNQVQYLTEVLTAVSDKGRTHYLKDKEKMEMGGKTYTTGFSSQSQGGSRFIYFNLDENYTEITGEIGSMYPRQSPINLNIHLDGKLYKTIKISGDKSPEIVTIPVSGVSQVKFSIDDSEGYVTNFGLGDFKIK